MKESEIMWSVRAVLAESGPCWRNSTGVDPTRGVRYGLGVGGADLVSVVPIVITEEWLGKTLGRFAGFEVKTNKGRASKEQILWKEAITRAGAAYHIVRSPEDAAYALDLARRP